MALTNLFTPKHQRLVLQCYPKGKKNFEKQPKSSELSYLLYYCNSRRTKLTKVSTFLKKKAAKDVKSRKFGDVYVTIVILCKITDSCKENLGIFFDDFISIIFTTLKQQVFKEDEYIVEGIVQFFESISLNLDSGFLSNSQVQDYEKFLSIYFNDLLSKDLTAMDTVQQQRLLRGCVILPKIKSIKHLEFFREFLFQAIYKTLKIYQMKNSSININTLDRESANRKKAMEEQLKKHETHLIPGGDDSEERLSRRLTHIRTESGFLPRFSKDHQIREEITSIMPVGLDDIDPNDFSEDLLNKLLLETLKEFFSSPESDLLPLSIRALNTVMVETPNVEYYKFIISGIPVHLRYLSILITVNGIVNSKDHSVYSDTSKAAILLKLISELLLSEVSIVALSVVDIVKKLIKYQISFAKENNSYNFLHDDLMNQIPQTLSIMNTRTFYKDQLNDVLHEILHLIESYADSSDSKSIMDVLTNDLSMLINHLDKTQSKINLSLFNDVTMILRDNLSRNTYERLFEITLNTKDLNNQTCLTFFESLRQLESLFDKSLTENILALALKTFKSVILLGGLSFYKMVEDEGEAVSTDYFVYHIKAAQFLNIKDYENKANALMRENRYFTTTELLNYYSDDKINPYSVKGSKIIADSLIPNTSMLSNDPDAQAKEDEIVYSMMNTSLQTLSIPNTPSFLRHADIKSLSGLQHNGHSGEKPSVKELKSLLGSHGKHSAASRIHRSDTLASQSVRSKVTNITFLLSELQDSSKNLRIRMPNEDQVSQLDERIIKQTKLNRNSFKKGRKSFDRIAVSGGNINRLSATHSNSSAVQTTSAENNGHVAERDEDEDDFVDASSDVSSIGELDNRGNLFV